MAGGHIYEQPSGSTINLTYNIGSGKVGTPSVTHTWQQILDWFKTSFYTKTEIYNKLEMDNSLSGKTNNIDILTTGNTRPYIPTAQYNPATVGFVISAISGKIVASGNYAWIGSMGDQYSEQIVTIGKILTNNNYTIILTNTGDANANLGVKIPLGGSNRTTTTFKIGAYVNAGGSYSAAWDWMIIQN